MPLLARGGDSESVADLGLLSYACEGFGWLLVARSERFAACVTDLPTPIGGFLPLSSMQKKFPVSG
jgi:hypothetical protein